VTVYEVRNSCVSHVHALRTSIVVDDKTVAQTELTRDLKEAVWDDIFVLDIPLYSQFVKTNVVGQNFVLCLKIICGNDLEAMDISGTSDPYVKIKSGSSSHKTRIIYKNLNPEWDEEFEMTIEDMRTPLHVSVWDNDLLGADDLIGEIFIR
jgi:Ca2+-dependent lipid-binding protein